MYEFYPDEIVVVVVNGSVVQICKVVKQEHGIVELEDSSKWYAASGLPVSGSAKRRLTPLNTTLEDQLTRRGRLLRILEMASILYEDKSKRSRITLGDLQRAEIALRGLLQGRATALHPKERELFWERVEARLAEAERGAVQSLDDDFKIP